MRRFLHLAVVLAATLCGCVKAPIPLPPGTVPPPVVSEKQLPLIRLSESKYPEFTDEADTASLRTAALRSLNYYRSQPSDEVYTLGKDSYTATEMSDSMDHLINLMGHAESAEALKKAIRDNFVVYQSAGVDKQRTVTFSSYYEPTIQARLHRTEKFRYPILGRPSDLIDVDLGMFNPAYKGAQISGRREGTKLVPYYTRGDIDSRKKLKGKARPVAWAKSPTDIFFLQIEGSGWLDLGKGKQIRIRYDGNNGRKYRSAGLYLINTGRVSSGLSHDKFENYLNTHRAERQSILNFNERYVFFRIDRSTAGSFAFGNIEQPLTAHRSIATDPKIFPKGALAWIITDRPVLNEEGEDTGKTVPVTRFMLNQDEGGAIQGPGRVDYFAGDGLAAHQFATHFWQKGTLYFLVKKRGT